VPRRIERVVPLGDDKNATLHGSRIDHIHGVRFALSDIETVRD
jgi:hypothetical protein